MTSRWHIDAGDEWRQPRVLDWHGKVVAVLPEESDHARLIAAAPEMLEALRGALVIIDLIPRPDGMGEEVNKALDERRAAVVAAIALAEGQSSSPTAT
jgi:hypothetical protein